MWFNEVGVLGASIFDPIIFRHVLKPATNRHSFRKEGSIHTFSQGAIHQSCASTWALIEEVLLLGHDNPQKTWWVLSCEFRHPRAFFSLNAWTILLFEFRPFYSQLQGKSDMFVFNNSIPLSGHIRARLVVPQSKISSFFISANTGCNNPTKKEETRKTRLSVFDWFWIEHAPTKSEEWDCSVWKTIHKRRWMDGLQCPTSTQTVTWGPALLSGPQLSGTPLISLSDINHILLASHRNIARFSLLISSTWPRLITSWTELRKQKCQKS